MTACAIFHFNHLNAWWEVHYTQLNILLTEVHHMKCPRSTLKLLCKLMKKIAYNLVRCCQESRRHLHENNTRSVGLRPNKLCGIYIADRSTKQQTLHPIVGDFVIFNFLIQSRAFSPLIALLIHKKAEKRRYQTPPAECSPRADNTSAFISGAGLSRSATFPTMLVRKATSLPPSSSFVVPEECLCHSVARYMDGWFLKTNQIPWTDTESCEVQQTELKLFQPAASPNALLQCYAIIDRPIQIIQTRRWSWKEKHN